MSVLPVHEGGVGGLVHHGVELGRVRQLHLEEPGPAITFLQDMLDIRAHDRRQLVQVPRKDHPHPAKGLPIAAIEAQRVIDHLHHVGADHRDLVDHHRLDGLDQPLVANLARIACVQQAWREIEEGVDGLPADIPVESLGEVVFKGKQQAVEIFAVG